MAMWPFGKKNNETDKSSRPDSGTRADTTSSTYTHERARRRVEERMEESASSRREPNPSTSPGETSRDVSSDASSDAPASKRTSQSRRDNVAPAVIQHDAIHGDTGPFDGDNVDITDFDFSDFSAGMLNLGSIQLPLPLNSQVQVEMGDQGPRMLHVITEHGRVTPVAFAAPNSRGMWDDSSQEIADGMREEGMPVIFETGPWGREVVGRGDNGIIRIIGVEGPRWLYRITTAAPHGKEDDMADLAREIIARSFVYRGTAPVLAGNSLPVELPVQLASQIQQAMQQQAQDSGGADQPGSQG